MRMNEIKTILTLLLLLAMPIAVQAWERGKVDRFATLPPGEAHPEGLLKALRLTQAAEKHRKTL